jgi:hypothetical protein
MTFGEQLYLALVLLAFFSFGIALALVSAGTNRYLRRRLVNQPAGSNRSRLNKAA